MITTHRFPVSKAILGHARIGGLDAAFLQFPDGRGAPRHWYVAAGDDGLRLACAPSDGPLVTGRPDASDEDIEAMLASASRSAPMPASRDAVIAIRPISLRDWTGRDFGRAIEGFWPNLDDRGEDASVALIREAIAPVAERLRRHFTVLSSYHARGPFRGQGTSPPADRAIARMLTMRHAEIEALAAGGEFPLLRPAIDFLNVRLDRPQAEVERETLGRLGVPEAAVRRVPEGRRLDDRTVHALRAFPLDWIPTAGDAEGWTAMARTAEVMLEMGATIEESRALVASARGDWPGFLDRCAKAAFPSAGTLEYVPLLSEIANAADVGRELAETLRELTDSQRDATALAKRLLMEGRSLPAILESSRIWHGRFVPPAPREISWPALLPRWTDVRTGVEIVPLASSDELTEEGAEMRHCVGGEGYALGCLRDEIRIVSLRRGDERVSTAEIRMGREDASRGAVVAQHLGKGNGSPAQEAGAALTGYLRLQAVAGAIVTTERRRVDLPSRTPEELERLLEAWRPYLSGRWRNATLDDLREALSPEDAAAPSFR